MNPQATAGRVVHYYESTGPEGNRPRAALVNLDTGPDGTAELTVLLSTGPMVFMSVDYSEAPQAGFWSWMPYQKQKAQTPGGNVSESAEPRP